MKIRFICPLKQSTKYKNTQIFITFIINHKNTINRKYLLGFLWLQTNVFVKIFTPLPLSSSPRGFFAMIARDFQIILKRAPATLILNVLWVVYIFRKGVDLSIFYWDYSIMNFLDYWDYFIMKLFGLFFILGLFSIRFCNLNTHEDKEVAFIGHEIGKTL